MFQSQKWLSVHFFAFFFTWGAFLPYWTGWLSNSKELSVSEASIIMSAGMFSRAFSTFVLFPAAAKFTSIRQVMKWTAIISLILMVLYIPSNGFIALLTITVLFSLVYPNLLPAMESSASILIQAEKIHYGKSRSYGSIGYAAALLVIGAAAAVWDEQSILWVMLIGLAAMAWLHLRPAPPPLSFLPEASVSGSKASNYKKLLASKPFTTVLSLAILLQGAHAAYYNFGYIYLQDLKVNSFYIGIILNVAVLLEILFFTQADRLFGHAKESTMFLIAGIGSTLRWLLIFLFPSVWVFIISQLLHSVSFGVAHYAFIQFISKRLAPDDIPAAQGMYAAFGMSLSTAILTFASGYLYEARPGLAFLGMTLCTVPSIVVVLLTRKKFNY